MIGRLWRRAPAWRLCLVAAIAFTALAAMFPPTLPHGTPALPASAPDASAHYVPQADPAPPGYAAIAQLPLGVGRQGVVPFAGRRLPLPVGSWQALVLIRDKGEAAVQLILLARIQGDRLTGLIQAAAPDALSHAAGLIGKLGQCPDAGIIAGETPPAPSAQAPFAHECWTLSGVRMATGASAQDTLIQRGLDRLKQLGIAMPDHMLALHYLRSSETGWMVTTMYLQDRRGPDQPVDRRVVAWCRKFATLLHQGFDGSLPEGALTQSSARDPG